MESITSPASAGEREFIAYDVVTRAQAAHECYVLLQQFLAFERVTFYRPFVEAVYAITTLHTRRLPAVAAGSACRVGIEVERRCEGDGEERAASSCNTSEAFWRWNRYLGILWKVNLGVLRACICSRCWQAWDDCRGCQCTHSAEQLMVMGAAYLGCSKCSTPSRTMINSVE